jgi:hypothetical protein
MSKTMRRSPATDSAKPSARAHIHSPAASNAGEITDADLDRTSGGAVGPCNMPARSRHS